MASAGKVDVTVKARVQPTVGIGPSTVAGSTVTTAAFALAIVAYLQGARDEATLGALVVGTVSLVTTLGGRYAQAVAALLRSSWGAKAPTQTVAPMTTTVAGASSSSNWSTYTAPFAAGAHVTNPDPVGETDEPGDPDALPDYETATNVPDDIGDGHARPDQEQSP